MQTSKLTAGISRLFMPFAFMYNDKAGAKVNTQHLCNVNRVSAVKSQWIYKHISRGLFKQQPVNVPQRKNKETVMHVTQLSPLLIYLYVIHEFLASAPGRLFIQALNGVHNFGF